MLKIGVVLLSLVSMPAWAQQHVDDGNSYHRVICIVPMVGSGTWADPKRPMFAPVASQIGRGKSGILGYYHEMTDDGLSAIVVFVAVDRPTLKPILTSTALGIQVFDPTVHSSQVIQAAMTAVQKNFDWKRFQLRVK